MDAFEASIEEDSELIDLTQPAPRQGPLAVARQMDKAMSFLTSLTDAADDILQEFEGLNKQVGQNLGVLCSCWFLREGEKRSFWPPGGGGVRGGLGDRPGPQHLWAAQSGGLGPGAALMQMGIISARLRKLQPGGLTMDLTLPPGSAAAAVAAADRLSQRQRMALMLMLTPRV